MRSTSSTSQATRITDRFNNDFIIENGMLIDVYLSPGSTQAAIPESVTSVTERAFSALKRLQVLELPSGFSLGVFWGCTSLEHITIASPFSVTTIAPRNVTEDPRKGSESLQCVFATEAQRQMLMGAGVPNHAIVTPNDYQELTDLLKSYTNGVDLHQDIDALSYEDQKSLYLAIQERQRNQETPVTLSRSDFEMSYPPKDPIAEALESFMGCVSLEPITIPSGGTEHFVEESSRDCRSITMSSANPQNTKQTVSSSSQSSTQQTQNLSAGITINIDMVAIARLYTLLHAGDIPRLLEQWNILNLLGRQDHQNSWVRLVFEPLRTAIFLSIPVNNLVNIVIQYMGPTEIAVTQSVQTSSLAPSQLFTQPQLTEQTEEESKGRGASDDYESKGPA